MPNPGPRRCIRRDIYPPRSIDRHSRPPDVSAFTLAKRIRRTVDRLDPQGMPRSYRGVRRTPSAPCAAFLHGLLQWHAHSLIVEQGRADITCRRGSGAHSVPSDPGWSASPICSGLICGRHNPAGISFIWNSCENLKSPSWLSDDVTALRARYSVEI